MEVAEIAAEAAMNSSLSKTVVEESKSSTLKQQTQKQQLQHVVHQSSFSSEQSLEQKSLASSSQRSPDDLGADAVGRSSSFESNEVAVIDTGKQLVSSSATSASSISSLSAVSVVKKSSTAVVSSSVPAAAPQPQQQQEKQEIISDIDRDIEQQEDVAKLKAQQQELLKQQQLLAQQIRQQQLLAEQLAAQNKLQEQQLQQKLQEQQQQQQQQQQQPELHVSKTTTFKESQNENGYTCKNESYEIEESSSVKKRIDLQKIFTPATDAKEILPKNRKLYASSAFYSPTLHPTVEDQVELARRISHSLSDISNQQSKGQSMYVNRKKRSVKWVHEGSGKDLASHEYEYEEESKENTDYSHDGSATKTETTKMSTIGSTANEQLAPLAKVPLKLVMNPRGQIRDFNSERETLNTETGLMSPDKCAELVTALNAQKGKGAELFAKRRRKAEKWVVDETNAGTQSPSGLPDYHQYEPKPPTSPSLLPAYSDAGKHRVQLNMHQEQLIEKYAKPGLKVVKTPWEAALETGSASAAFVEEHKRSPYAGQLTPTPTPTLSAGPMPQYDYNRGPSPFAVDVTDSGPSDYAPHHKLPQVQVQQPKRRNYNSQRDLAYKPNVPQGWKAPSVVLPKELYVPKEIPLESYAAPPVLPSSLYGKPTSSPHSWTPAQAPAQPAMGSGFKHQPYPSAPMAQTPPVSKQQSGGSFAASYGSGPSYGPPKQTLLPQNSYQTVPQSVAPAPAVNFNPSPLPYEKLAKFENSAEEAPPMQSPSQSGRPLAVPQTYPKVRNLSPTPYGARSSSSCSQSFPPQSFSDYGTAGPGSRPTSQQFGSYGSPTAGGRENGSALSPRSHAADLLHCQNFNNAARGWGAGGTRMGTVGVCRNVKPLPVTANLPYTDF